MWNTKRENSGPFLLTCQHHAVVCNVVCVFFLHLSSFFSIYYQTNTIAFTMKFSEKMKRNSKIICSGVVASLERVWRDRHTKLSYTNMILLLIKKPNKPWPVLSVFVFRIVFFLFFFSPFVCVCRVIFFSFWSRGLESIKLLQFTSCINDLSLGFRFFFYVYGRKLRLLQQMLWKRVSFDAGAVIVIRSINRKRM